MPLEEGVVRRVRRREQVARLEAEIEDARPYLELAREIRAEVLRVADDGDADTEALVSAIDAVPRRERNAIARAVFAQLSPEQQWEILVRVFDDAELRAVFDAERRDRIERLGRDAAREQMAADARATGRLDMCTVPDGERVTLGLFRERDVHAAIDLGHRSSSCARRVVLAADGPDGSFRVIEDVFNPAGGYFVTGEYDQATWEQHDRLPAHTIVRPGSRTAAARDESFAPVLHVGGRVDFEREEMLTEGRLHLGYAMVGDVDVFAKRGSGQ